MGLEEPSVSGAHARVQVDGEGRLVVTDLGSRNGTTVRRRGPFGSAQRLNPGVPCVLETDDELVLAGRLSFTVVPPEAAVASQGGASEPPPGAPARALELLQRAGAGGGPPERTAGAAGSGAGGGLLSSDVKGALEQAGRVVGTVGGALNTVVEGGRAARAGVDRVQATVQEGLDVLNGAAGSAASSWGDRRSAEQELEEDALQVQRQHWTSGLWGGSEEAKTESEPESKLEPETEPAPGPAPAPVPASTPSSPEASAPAALQRREGSVSPDEAVVDVTASLKPDVGGADPAPEDAQLVVPQMVSAESSLVLEEPGDLVAAASGLAEGGDDGSFASTVQQALTGGMGSIMNSQVQLNYKPTFLQGASVEETKDAKSALLTAILGLERGLSASEEARKRVQKLACALEASNPTRNPLRSPLINGEWELQYTTCRMAVEGGVPGVKLRPVAGGIRQRVDMYSLKIVNESTYKLAFSEFTNEAVADLVALSDTRLQLKFTSFKIGPLQMSAPPRTPARLAIEWELSATGRGGSGAWLDTTYVDYDLRVGRNDTGDLFILTRVE